LHEIVRIISLRYLTPNQGQPNSRPVPIAPYAKQSQNVSPIAEKRSWTCVNVKFGKYKVLTLLDTGSDITVISSVLARKMRWKIFSHDLTSVKAANGEDMLLINVAFVTLRAGTEKVDSEVQKPVSPDTTGFILGIDWMEQNECVFHCKKKQDRINDEWIELKREPSVQKVRKIYVPQDTIIPPSQQVFAYDVIRVVRKLNKGLVSWKMARSQVCHVCITRAAWYL